MHNTIVSLALLKVNWDHLKKDYLENFLPFIATLCGKKNYAEIDINTVCDDFATEYGLKIPYHPMISILERARKRGILTRSYHKLYPVKDKITKLDFTEDSKEQTRQHNKVADEFIKYAKQNYSLEMSHEEAEQAFLVLLQQRDLNILFAAEGNKLFPEVESKKGHQFVLNKFIQHCNESEPELFSFILNMAIGHILASAILYADFAKFEGKFAKIRFYFDTRFVLRVLETEGKERQRHYIEFLRLLSDHKAYLFVFRHTYDEIMTVLNNCLRWVENPSYDPTKASIACNYFVQNNYRESDVERFIVRAETILKDNNIEIVEAPDPNEYGIYQIDEEQLENIIITRYKEGDFYFDESEIKFTLLKDIKSISSIYRLRRGRRPHNVSKVGSLFVTTNWELAYASNIFQRSQGQGDVVFPTCVTDVLLGTLVWLQSPAKVISLNERKMIADCYAAVQPPKSLIRKYRHEVEKLREEDKITEDEYYLLRTHRVAWNLLEEKTLGDPDKFSDKTPEEILEVIKRESQMEPIKKYIEAKEKLEKSERDLAFSKEETGMLKDRIHNRANSFAKIVGWAVFFGLGVLFVVGILFQTFEIKKLPQGARVLFWVITGALGALSVLTGFNIRGLREKIIKWVESKLISFFT